MNEEKTGISILGQKIQWPDTWPGMLTALSGCVTAVLIIATLFVWSDSERFHSISNLIEYGMYAPNGKRSSGEDVVEIYRFWTPNMYTKRDILHEGDNVPESELEKNKASVREWYWASDCLPGENLEPEVTTFLKKLKLLQPVGINIFPMKGIGKSPLKRGYVWEMSVSKNNPISRSQLLAVYTEHWKRESDIWLEKYEVQSTKD